MGWTSREPILGAAEGDIVAGGLFRPFALVRGRAAASWRLEQGEVLLTPFDRLGRTEARALDAEAADVRRFLAAGDVSSPD